MAQPLLKGVAYISGAASGIGKATAIALAQHGVRRLALADINADAQEQTVQEIRSLQEIGKDVEILSLKLDTGKEADIVASHQQIVKKWGRIDYAINNAGIGSLTHTTEATGEQYSRMIQINLLGVMLAQREQIKLMLKQEPLESSTGRRDRGVIVNTASMLGLVGAAAQIPTPDYVAAKHGVVGVTKADAISFASKGIRINCICPGYVDSPMMSAAGGISVVMEGELKKVPAARFAEVGEIASAIIFLASPLSSYMHGAALRVDGGFTAQ